MTKICKEYIKEIKIMFPFKSKKERNLIRKLTRDIENFCMDENVTSKEQLYKNCGKPVDVVAEYFSTQEMSYIVRKVKINKWIKALIALIIAVIIGFSAMYATMVWQNHEAILREEMVGVETVIE